MKSQERGYLWRQLLEHCAHSHPGKRNEGPSLSKREDSRVRGCREMKGVRETPSCMRCDYILRRWWGLAPISVNTGGEHLVDGEPAWNLLKEVCPQGLPAGMRWPVEVDFWEPTGLGEGETQPSREGLVCVKLGDCVIYHSQRDACEKERAC